MGHRKLRNGLSPGGEGWQETRDQAELIGGKIHRKGHWSRRAGEAPTAGDSPKTCASAPSPQEGMSESTVKALTGFQKNKCVCPSQSALSGQMYGTYLKCYLFHHCDCGSGVRESPSDFEHACMGPY